MKRRITLRMTFLVLLAITVGFVPGMAQQPSNVKIEVRKMENGQVDVRNENRSLEDVGSLQDLLDQYGVKEELGDLQPGEEVEIIIRRKQKADVVREMVIDLDSDRPAPVIEEAKKRPLLGVFYNEDEETGGGKVTGLIQNSAAEANDIRAGDVIIQLDKKVINGIESLQDEVRAHKAGDKVKVVLLRDGKKINKNVTLGEDNQKHRNHWESSHFKFEDFNRLPHGKIMKVKPSGSKAGRPMLGVTLNVNRTVIENNGDRQDETNIRVQGVLPNSAASNMGIMTNDRIVAVNGQQVNSIMDIRNAMNGKKAGDKVTVTVERNGDGNMKKLSGNLTDLKHDGQEEEVEINVDFDFDNIEINDIELKEMDDFDWISNDGNQKVIIRKFDDNDNVRGEVREFHMTISMSDVSDEEAQALSAASGEDFAGQSNLDLARFEVGPNPNSGLFNLSFDLPSEGNTQIRVLDLNGEEIYRESLGNFTGSYNKDFDISKFAKGVYFLQITQGDRAFTKKVVTQ